MLRSWVSWTLGLLCFTPIIATTPTIAEVEPAEVKLRRGEASSSQRAPGSVAPSFPQIALRGATTPATQTQPPPPAVGIGEINIGTAPCCNQGQGKGSAARADADHPAQPEEAGRKPEHALPFAHRFLTEASTGIGENVNKILNVQGNLDELAYDVDGVYGSWRAREQGLLAERDELRGEIVKLQTMLMQQKGYYEQEYRLQNQHAMLVLKVQQAETEHRDERAKWAAVRSSLMQEVQRLENQTPGTQGMAAWAVSIASNRTSFLRDENHALQLKIGDLSAQQAQVGNSFSDQDVNFKKQRQSLLTEMQDVQHKIHSLQDQLILKARWRHEAQSLQQQVAAQAAAVTRAQKTIVDTGSNCSMQAQALREAIKNAQQQMVAIKDEHASCQTVEGENQRLQARLNTCHLQSQPR